MLQGIKNTMIKGYILETILKKMIFISGREPTNDPTIIEGKIDYTMETPIHFVLLFGETLFSSHSFETRAIVILHHLQTWISTQSGDPSILVRSADASSLLSKFIRSTLIKHPLTVDLQSHVISFFDLIPFLRS